MNPRPGRFARAGQSGQGIRILGAILLGAVLMTGHRAQAATAAGTNAVLTPPKPAPQPGQTGNRFLLIVENSASTRKIDTKLYASFFVLLGGSLFDRIREGDTLGVWLINADTDTRFPMKVWEYSNRGTLAGDIGAFVKEAGFKKRARWDILKKNMDLVVANVRDLTIFMVVDGEEPPTGTPFDRDIQQWFAQHAAEAIRDKEPVVLGLAARGGKIIAYSVGRAGETLQLPPEPVRPVVPKPSFFSQADTNPPTPPPVTRRSTPIIISKATSAVTNSDTARPVPPPAPIPAPSSPTAVSTPSAAVPAVSAVVPSASVPFLPEVGPEPPRVPVTPAASATDTALAPAPVPVSVPPVSNAVRPTPAPSPAPVPAAASGAASIPSSVSGTTGTLARLVLPTNASLHAIHTGGVVEVVLQLSSNGLQVMTSRPPSSLPLTAAAGSATAPSAKTQTGAGLLPQVTAQARSGAGQEAGMVSTTTSMASATVVRQDRSWIRLVLAAVCMATALVWGFWISRRKPRESSISQLMPKK